MKALFVLVPFLSLSLDAHATSIRQENGVLLSGTAGKLGWTKKYISLDKEAASALFELLSKQVTVKKDGEDGLSNESVKVDKISCRRETNVIQATDPYEFNVYTTCTIEIPYGIIAYLFRTKSEPKQYRIETSSPELLKAMKANPDTKVDGRKYDYANGALHCEESDLGVVCNLLESVK